MVRTLRQVTLGRIEKLEREIADLEDEYNDLDKNPHATEEQRQVGKKIEKKSKELKEHKDLARAKGWI